MINNIAFSGRRIFDNYRTLEGPMVQKTSAEEDAKDLSDIIKSISAVNKNDIVVQKNANSNSSLPTVIADKYSLSLCSDDRFEPSQLYIKNLKENITRAFSSHSESHDVRTLFKECLQFIRNCANNR